MMMEFKIWTHFARAFQNYILSCSCWCSVIQRFSVNSKDCVDDILYLFLCKRQFWELWWESDERLRKDLFGCSVANVCVSVEVFCTLCFTTVLVFPTRNFYLKLRHPLALSAYYWNPQVTGWRLVIPWGKQPEKAESWPGSPEDRRRGNNSDSSVRFGSQVSLMREVFKAGEHEAWLQWAEDWAGSTK